MAGLVGHKMRDPLEDEKFPIVEAVHGWGLLLRPDSPFRESSI